MVSVLLGALVLGEELGPRVIAGMAVVLLGVALTRRRATVITEGKSSSPRPDDLVDLDDLDDRDDRTAPAPAPAETAAAVRQPG